MSMITATAWVPRGHAAQFPTKCDFNDEEFDRIAQLARLRLDDAQEDLRSVQSRSNETREKDGGRLQDETARDDNDLGEYDLEHYDDTDHEDNDDAPQGPGGIFGNIKSLSYYTPGEKDPYVTLNEAEDQEDEEREELQILPTDNLILATKVEDEIAHLEVYVYEDVEDNLYVHHDLMLPAIPLAVEYINYSLGNKENTSSMFGNFVAVGTMDPDIELWDLDTIDSVYPSAILGQGAVTNTSKPKKKRKSKSPHSNYHVDAVLSLASNRNSRNVLASASADKTIKLWDLNMSQCASSFSYHTDKVCSLAWHPEEPTALLSGGYDRNVVAADVRAAETSCRKWTVESDVEGVKWDPIDSTYFYVSTESGNLHLFDARVTPTSGRTLSTAVWQLQAHDKALSAFDINPTIPGFIATGAADKQVKLWNVQPGGGPSMVVSRDFGVGRVFSTEFAPDAEVGFRLAIAGSKGSLQVWDTSTNPAIRRAFATRVAHSSEDEIKERLVTVTEELSESSDGDEAGEHELGEDWVDEEEAGDNSNNGFEDDEMDNVSDERREGSAGGVRVNGSKP